MKRILIIIIVAIAFNAAGQQKGEILFPEQLEKAAIKSAEKGYKVFWSDDFSDKSKWEIHNDVGNTQNWKITSYPPMGYYTQYLGQIKSETPEMVALFDADALGNGEDMQRPKLTLKEGIDCSEKELVIVEFYSYYARWDSRVFFNVSTDDGETWHKIEIHEDVLNQYATENPDIIQLNITDVAAGESNVKFQFFYNGLDTNWGFAWIVDDLKVFDLNGLDASMQMDNYWLMGTTDDYKCEFELKNTGKQNIESLTFSYQVNDENIGEEITVSDLEIESLNSKLVSHTELYNFDSAGLYVPKVIVSKINGEDFALEILGDTIEVYENEGKQAILGELFTSSTCSPCAVFNPFYDLVQTKVSPSLLSTVKFQMNWPGVGDPYYTQGGSVRKAYYSVSSVPSLYLNGEFIELDNYGLDLIREKLEQDAEVSMDATVDLDDEEIYAKFILEGHADLSGCVLIASVNEKQTYNNVMTNGETEFNHVSMKMISTASGIDLSSYVMGDSITMDYDLGSTNIEEFNDLELVAYIQNVNSKEIIQSTLIDLSFVIDEEGEEEDTTGVNVEELSSVEIKVWPNPVTQNFKIDGVKEGRILLFNSTGTLVLEKEFTKSQSINIGDLQSGLYVVKVIADKNIFTDKIIVAE